MKFVVSINLIRAEIVERNLHYFCMRYKAQIIRRRLYIARIQVVAETEY